MGCRLDRHLDLTVAMAFVDRYVSNAQVYFERKAQIQSALPRPFTGVFRQLSLCVALQPNRPALDQPLCASVQVVTTADGPQLADIAQPTVEIVEEKRNAISEFSADLVKRALPLC